jgi:UDP-2,4-diacetamido-2,4,6-trideoxy-beta-L-altropyranose hydrolase
MSPNKILFRTAGGKAKKQELGLGHIFRTINLANQFPKNDVFFLIEDFGGVKNIFLDHGFKKNIFLINSNLLIKDDFEITKKIIKNNFINTVVIDKYKISQSFVNKLQNYTKVILIQDLKNKNLKSDLLINGFIGFKNQIFTNKHGTKCLLGPKYQILNNNFSKNFIKKQKSIDILASFGGFDEKHISDILADSIESYASDLKIKIILGPVASKSEKLSLLQKKYPKNIMIIPKTKNMAKEISHSKFGICTGGLTSYEFASMGIPFAIICDEKHQLVTAKEWSKHKIAKNLGLVNCRTKEKINNLIQDFLGNSLRYKKNSNLVDGFGAKRVANEILKI